VNNQEPCARLLLFRGADKEALNFANQTPYQVAVIAGNMELAETIQDYRPQDVGKFEQRTWTPIMSSDAEKMKIHIPNCSPTFM